MDCPKIKGSDIPEICFAAVKFEKKSFPIKVTKKPDESSAENKSQ